MSPLQKQAETLRLCESLADDFKAMASALKQGDEGTAETFQIRIRMLQSGLALLKLNPHLNDPARAFVNFHGSIHLNWLMTGAMGFPPATGTAVAQFIMALLLEVDFGALLREDETQAALVNVAIKYAQAVQKEALTLVILTTGEWCHGLVEKLIERPILFMEIGND